MNAYTNANTLNAKEKSEINQKKQKVNEKQLNVNQKKDEQEKVIALVNYSEENITDLKKAINANYGLANPLKFP